MYTYGKKSMAVFDTLHPDLKMLCTWLIERYNVTLISGYRGEEEQNELFRTSNSHLPWPRSKHNTQDKDGNPWSKAVDMAPWFDEPPHIHFDKKYRDDQIHFAGIVRGAAECLYIPVICGVDWNENLNLYDNWVDAWHFELK